MKVILLLLAFVSLACARPKWFELDDYSFEQYLRDFQKKYSPAEYLKRRSLFEERLVEIRRHNQDTTKTWKNGVNHLTDQTDMEIKSLFGYKRGASSKNSIWKKNYVIDSSRVAPSQVDWRTQGVVTPVKDQGRCGSCWSFAAAETVESHNALVNGKLFVLSEQQILDCTSNPQHCGGTGGCGGGTAELAFEMAQQRGGLATEWTYPYISYFGKNFNCSLDSNRPPVVKLDGYVKLAENEEEPLVHAVSYEGPIAVSVDAGAWSRYETGVFDGCNQTSPTINHAVQLVGFDTDSSGQAYWIVRNSWSPTWGENGYIRIKKTTEQRCGVDLSPQDGTSCDGGPNAVIVCGTCGILYDSSYPLIRPAA